MKSYFFIPATKIHKLQDVVRSGVDQVVIDLEDAVLAEDRAALTQQLKLADESIKAHWIRVPLRDEWDEEIDTTLACELASAGWHYLVIPKIKSIDEFDATMDALAKTNAVKACILLVEHPRMLIDLREVMLHKSSAMITSIAFGAHDFVNHIGGEFSFARLQHGRMQCLYVARAFGKVALDIASVNISDEQDFLNEVRDGLNSGFDGKLIIHPLQWSWMQSTLGHPQRDLIWAKKVMESLPGDVSGKEIEPFILDGEIIEKPHVERAMNILKRKG